MTQTTQQPPHAQPTPRPTGWKALTTDARDWWTTHWMGPVAAGIFIVVNITVWIWRLTHHIIHRPQDITMLRIFGHLSLIHI